jgi:signal transduction histidine kinase/ActR/RegA family two-component response regulator
MRKSASRTRAGPARKAKKPARRPPPEDLVRRHGRELLALETLARVLASPDDRAAMLTRALEIVTAMARAEAGMIFLAADARHTLTLEVASGVAAVAGIRLGDDGANRAMKPGGVLRHPVSNSLFTGETQAALAAQGFASVVGVPIFFQERFLGVICLLYRASHIREVSDTPLMVVGSQLGIALASADLYARLQAQEAEAREMSRSLSATNLQLQDSFLRLRQAHEQLLQSEKLSAMGQLIAGVAHELNNPLSVVMGYAQLLLGDCRDDNVRVKAEAILSQAERAANIVRNLLTFARKSRGERRPVNLNEILERTVELRAYHLRVGNVEVVRELDETLPATQGDPQQLEQVFLNLINNAHYAMATANGRGRLTLRTFRTKDRFARPAIGVEVADDGPGIPPEVVPHVFNPFFTTKPVGEGTGLGLAICHGIVEEHGGEITYTSVPGAGASFRIRLPILIPAEERAGEEARQSWPSPGQRVLIIDDEEGVREVLREALANYGHVAHTTSSGREALRWMETLPYDLVICDVKMPDMDGKTFYAEVHSRWPALSDRVVFCTGGVVNPKTQSFLQELGCRYVAKPFKVEELLALLNPRPRKPLATRQ